MIISDSAAPRRGLCRSDDAYSLVLNVGGQSFEDAEDFAYGRFSWRVTDDLAPDARLDKALQLLASSIALGMFAFRDLEARLDDPAEHAAANSFIDYLAPHCL